MDRLSVLPVVVTRELLTRCEYDVEVALVLDTLLREPEPVSNQTIEQMCRMTGIIRVDRLISALVRAEHMDLLNIAEWSTTCGADTTSLVWTIEVLL